MITWADVETVAPQLAAPAVSVGQQAAILDEVSLLEAESWGSEEKCDLGRKYLAAHLGTVVAAQTAATKAGPVVSESAGPISRSYGSPSIEGTAFDGDLTSTSYGRRYIALRDSYVVGRIGLGC